MANLRPRKNVTVQNKKKNNVTVRRKKVNEMLNADREAVSKGRICTKQEIRPKKIKVKKIDLQYVIDATEMAILKNLDVADLKKYLLRQIKVEGLKNNLCGKITVTRSGWKLKICSKTKLTMSYLKHLVKRYISKIRLADMIHVVSKGKSLQLQYFRIAENAATAADASN